MAFEFDPMGRLLRRTDQLGDTVTMNYDLASRVLQRDYRTRVNSPSGTIADSDVFTHDRMGRILSGISGRYGNTIAMAYDDIGRPQGESLTISGQTYTIGYAHDAMNRRSGMTLPDGSVVLRTYTSRSQLRQAKLDGFTLDTRTYDAGRRHSTSTYGNGVVITHAYRTNGSLKDDLLASITTTHPGGIPAGQQVGNYSYTWDANRNKLSESITGVLSGMGFQPVSYDNEERLTACSRSDGNQGQTWNLSLVGDWNIHTQTGTSPFTQARVHGPAHEFLAFTGTSTGTLTYDVKGNATSRPATLAVPALNLTWDFGNQLAGADTNGSPSSQEVSFRYDVLGRRVGRIEGASSVVYVQAGQQTIADYVAGQPPSAPTRVYVYGSYIDEPIARRQSGNLAYFHRNQQYSIVALSDSTGAVIERYSYTAHGQPTIYNAAGTVLAASAFDNRYTYTGREWDAALALHYFRARWYDPAAGRFFSRDPLGYVDGMNTYITYWNQSLTDPYGTQVPNEGSTIADARQSLADQGVSPAIPETFSPGQFSAGSSFPLYVPHHYSPSLFSDEQLFEEWIRLESRDLEWVKQLPKCPCFLPFNRRCVGWGNLAGQTMSFTQIYPVNPDPADWDDPSVPTPQEACLHPGAKYSMRSRSSNGNYNQCTYDQNGKLITEPPGAGTVDRAKSRTGPHVDKDVDPVLIANSLDGGAKYTRIDVLLASVVMLQPPGPHVLAYYRVRPTWHDDCEKNP